MTAIGLIVFARAVHVLGGVAWAGTAFVMAGAFLPVLRRYGKDGAAPWLGLVARRIGMMAAISAGSTVLSGTYLSSVLHHHDDSASGLLLKAGALFAFLALATVLVVVQPASRKLEAAQKTLPDSAEASLEAVARLRRRVAVGVCVVAALLGVSVLFMAVFRYAGALI